MNNKEDVFKLNLIRKLDEQTNNAFDKLSKALSEASEAVRQLKNFNCYYEPADDEISCSDTDSHHHHSYPGFT